MVASHINTVLSDKYYIKKNTLSVILILLKCSDNAVPFIYLALPCTEQSAMKSTGSLDRTA